jgi:hypothetical protein
MTRNHMSAIYTTTPPADACHLWMQGPGGEYVAHYKPGDEVDGRYLYGPRIPTAAELHQHAEAMHANIVARAEAERRCRELEASLAHERRCHYALLDAAQECGSAIHAALGLPPSDDVFQELGNVGKLVAMDSPEDSE